MQAGGQKNELGGEDGKLTIVTVLGGCTAGETDNTNDITTTDVLVLILERNIAGDILGLAHDLNLDTLSAEIVEDQLVAGGALCINTTGQADGDLGLLLALGKGSIVLEELAQVGVDLELVGVRVGALGLAQLIDSLAADLEVLLKESAQYLAHEP